jgi:hypothetical protein
VEAQIAAGFLKTPRTLSAIQRQLDEKQALQFKVTDLSPGLTRLVREGKLTRDKNADGQYEYAAA